MPQYPSTLSGRGLIPFLRLTAPLAITFFLVWNSAPFSYRKKFARNAAKMRYSPLLLVFTGIAGMSPRPSSIDGHLLFLSSVSVVVPPYRAIAEDARRFACPIGFHYRSGRCDN